MADGHGGERAAGVTALLAVKQPTRRFTQPSKISSLVRMLASPAFHNLTGAAIPLDGGWTAQ